MQKRPISRSSSLVNLFVTLCLMAILPGCASRTIYVGGSVLTVDAEDRIAEAIGVENERIGIVGTEAEVRAWAGSSADVVDVEGATIVPGFIDAHGHFPGEGVWGQVADLNSPPIGDVKNLDQLLELLRAQAEGTSAGEWVAGMGYDDTLLAEMRHPTREDLDRVSTEHPVGILHISGHLGVVNSRGLEALGYHPETPNMKGGVLRRDPEGRLTGVLEENAIEPLQTLLYSPSLLGGLAIVKEAGRRAVSRGVTTAQSGYTPGALVRLLPWVSRFGLVPIRLVLWPGMEAIDEVLASGDTFSTYDPDWVEVGAVKLVADGSIQGYTGYLSEPYHVPPGDDPSYRGYPRIEREELIERAVRYHQAGYQLAIHGNGDASIDDILDALDQAFADGSGQDRRPIVIHAQMTRDDQLDRMKQLGVIPSFFSLHTYYWGDRHKKLFMGPERANRMSPAASALARDLTFTIHCDAPVVPMEPLRLIWAAVNRKSASGDDVGVSERISARQALRATTIDAAFQHFQEDSRGSLEAGKLADFVLLSASPYDVPTEIDDIEVLETFVAGERVYQK